MIKEKNSENGIKTTYMKTVITNKKTFESMKKHFIYATLSAIALFGAVSFSACSSSEDVAEDINPTFDGEAVKTQFTISFPENVAKTRQTAGTVQNTEALTDFRGMDNIVLYPFAATAPAKPIPPSTTAYTLPITSTSSKLGDAIQLTQMLKPTPGTVSNSIPNGTSGLTANNNSVLFNDVVIPIGTGSFLFYGKAIDNSIYTGDGAAANNKFYNGSLTMVNTSSATPKAAPNPGNIAFDLEQINSNSTVSAAGTALATYLTSIAQATNWAESAAGTGLGDLYANFIKLKAGSSLTAQAAVKDLYKSISKNTDAVSVAIAGAITSNTYVSAYDAAAGTLTFQTSIDGFPGDINLPDGAALLAWDGTNKQFTQSTSGSDLFGTTGASKITNAYADYVFPASLYYYCNSGIGTATTSQAGAYESTRPTSTTDATPVNNTWSDILSKYTPNTQVKSNTRSVAILDPIQYAVGRLDMTVSALTTDQVGTGDDAKYVMYDKKGEAYDTKNGFEVTGVLIGGQKQVGFDFKTNASAVEKTIYDNITKSQKDVTLTVTRSAASVTNYTLALETGADVDTYVAVEFVNKGADFEGVDGVIPAGCKFYLVGQLKPSSGTGYNATTLNQVFKQDHKTVVTFSIAKGTEGQTNTTGLGAAYNTIPDLRTPQLELGLSVDLHWETGLAFSVTF